MDCQTALEAISAALDGELTPAQQSALNSHLTQCPACRARQAELAGLHSACADGLDAPAPPELRETILSNLPPQDPPVKPSPVVVPIRWHRWAAIAAVFALVAVGAWQLPRFLFPPSASTQSAALSIDGNKSSLSEDITTGAENNAEDAALPAAQAPAGEESSPLEGGPDSVPAQSPESPEAVQDRTAESPGRDQAQSPSEAPSDPSGPAKRSASAATPAGESDGGESSLFRANRSLQTAGASESSAVSETDTAAVSEETVQAADGFNALEEDFGDFLNPASAETPVAAAEAAGESDAPAVEYASPTPTPRPEVPPPGSTQVGENASASDGLEETTAADQAEDVYCGVLTLTEGRPSSAFPCQVQPNGQVWYFLPARAFWTLVEQLKGESDCPGYSLRMSGEDVSPQADQGLVICPAP